MKIPRDVSGDQLAKALRKLEYQVVRQDGSHLRLTTQKDGQHHVTVPNHSSLKIGTFKAILNLVAQHHRLNLPGLLSLLEL